MSHPRPSPHSDDVLLALLHQLDERSCLPGELVEGLVADSLPLAEADRVRAHLMQCLSCLSTFARIQSLHESPSPSDAYAEAVALPRPLPERGSEPRLPLVDTPTTRILRPELERLARLDQGPGAAPSVLIMGEDGTGKSLVAQAIHALSRRASRPFIEVRCWALPAERMEVEMFGYEGATAPSSHVGLLELADGGTLLLDGIHKVPLELQAKLLKVFEEKSVRRLGGRVAQSLEARVIACTDADLDDAVRRGAFRADLLHRLKEVTLALRPLRERPEDVVPLARYFVSQFAQDHGGLPARLSAGAEERLRDHPWPGNVRELSAVIERAARLCGGGEIDAETLGLPTP
jgi:DNA-binding NtrC family response regulator